ncbi:MAG: helix-turn-helix domain-containing protein, partial [Pisciglobus halotolerans]|nr:helix-turn-helix domain-containing protein [Pisciglobus halotolerans]
LTPSEQELLLDLVFCEMTVTDAAKKYQVSRKTIYKRRQKISSKLQPYYEEISDQTTSKTIGGENDDLSY